MDSGIANGFQFDKGEDAERIISRFVELSVLHYDNTQFTPFAIALEVFNQEKLRDPATRSASAATEWANALDIQERIRAGYVRGKYGAFDASEEALIARVLAAAEKPYARLNDIVAAHRLVAEIKGYIRKQIEVKGGVEHTQSEFLKALSGRLPA